MKKSQLITGLHQSLGPEAVCIDIMVLSTLSDDAQSVVVKVLKSVGSSLYEFHLSMEAFGNTVVLTESPHTGDGVFPFFERTSEYL